MTRIYKQDPTPLAIGAVFLILGGFTIFSISNQKECLRWEQKEVTYPGHWQYFPMSIPGMSVPMGKNSSLIWVPEKTELQRICLEYKNGEESEKASSN